MLLVGVDEAGYGPLLGPLVVAGSAFRVPDPERGAAIDADAAGACLKRALAGRGRGVPRLRVDDSKKVYVRGGLGALERPLLALLDARGSAWPEDLDDLLVEVGIDPGARRDRAWYAGRPPRFPLRHEPGELDDEGRDLRERLAREDVEFVGLVADVLPEDRLNALFDASGNKSDTLFDVSAGVLERLAAHARPGEPVIAVMDRQGGRKRYQGPLAHRFPEAFPWTLGESAECSRYRLDRPGGAWHVSFRVGADAAAPQVALASMLAKYLREVFMGLWNDWFAALCPDVRPTAGYAQDGRRWLDESRALRDAAGIPDAALARTR
jgi:hypothetical protein